jgi:hypothetical protein
VLVTGANVNQNTFVIASIGIIDNSTTHLYGETSYFEFSKITAPFIYGFKMGYHRMRSLKPAGINNLEVYF